MAEDRRIALAALAVTAVVGVAAPIGTILATNAHDSHRLQLEQTQSDRQELRRVLDHAAASLYSARRQFTSIARPAVARAQRDVVVVARLKPELDDLLADLSRVQIRLGSGAPAAKSMNAAVSFFSLFELSALRTAPEDRFGLAVTQRSKFEEAIARFVDDAHRVGRARP